MTENVGWATLSVIPSFKGFEGHLTKGTSGPLAAAGVRGGGVFGDAAGRSAGSRFGRVFSTAARAALLGAAGAGALAFKVGSDAITAASDLAESQNKVNVVFGDGAKIVRRYGRQAAKSIGQSRQQALEAAGTFGNLFVNLGLNGKAAAKMSTKMVGLASDLASFNNIAPEEALERLRSGLLGEQEAVERLGISITEQGLKQRAFDLGLTESTKGVLPAAIRTQAAYAEILAQTGLAQGDFERTSGNLANKQRILSARWEDAKAKLGRGLLPIMSDFVGFVTDKGIPAFEDFSDWFNDEGVPAIKDLTKKLRPLANEVLPAAADAFGVIRDAAEDALPFAEGIVSAFNDMPSWAKKALIGGGAAGLGAKKLGLLGSARGGGSGLLGLVTKAKPLPVFVVNQVPGAGGPGLVPTPEGKPKGGIKGNIGKVGGFLGSIAGFPLPALGSQVFEPPTVRDEEAFDRIIGKTREHRAEVDKTRVTWLHTKEAVEDYAAFVNQRVPREIHTTVTGLDVANRQVRELITNLLEARSIRLGFDGEGLGGTTPPNRSPRTSRAGGLVIEHQTVVAHDYKDFVQQSQRQAIGASLDGGPR